MKTLLLTLALLAVAIILLGAKTLFFKGGRFRIVHAHEVMAKWRKHHS